MNIITVTSDSWKRMLSMCFIHSVQTSFFETNTFTKSYVSFWTHLLFPFGCFSVQRKNWPKLCIKTGHRWNLPHVGCLRYLRAIAYIQMIQPHCFVRISMLFEIWTRLYSVYAMNRDRFGINWQLENHMDSGQCRMVVEEVIGFILK